MGSFGPTLVLAVLVTLSGLCQFPGAFEGHLCTQGGAWGPPGWFGPQFTALLSVCPEFYTFELFTLEELQKNTSFYSGARLPTPHTGHVHSFVFAGSDRGHSES